MPNSPLFRGVKRAIDFGEEVVWFGTTWAGPLLVPDTGVYSAVDIETPSKRPIKKRRLPKEMKRKGSSSRSGAGRRVLLNKRKRKVKKGGKRRVTSGFRKKVQNVTLSLAESLRWETTRLNLVHADTTTATVSLCQVPERTGVTLIDTKNRRLGTSIWANGVRVELHFQNLLPSTSIMVRVILGWKKNQRAVGAINNIFEDPNSEANTTLAASTTHYPSYIYSPTDSKTLVKKRDVSFKLAGATESTEGNNHKTFKLWLPLNREIKFEGFTEGFESQSCDPHLWYYATNETGVVIAGNILQASMRGIFYFKDM